MNENQHGKLESVFYWGIPIIATAIVSLIVLNFLGYPVWKTVQEWGGKLPIVSKSTSEPTHAQAKKPDDLDVLMQQNLKSESQLREMDQKIAELTKQLSSNQKGMEELTKRNEELQTQLDNKQSNELQTQMREVSAIYANISPSKAAAMFESMSLDEASLTLSTLELDQQSSILGKMKDVRKAAQITMIIKEIAMLNETDQTLLKDQVRELAQKYKNPTDAVSETIAGMPPTHSASIIQSMMGTNSQVAMALLRNINTNTRSQILSEIVKADAKLAAQITADLNN